MCRSLMPERVVIRRHALRPVDAVGTPPPLQEAYTYAPLPPEGWTPHRFRTYVLHRHKVGGMHVGGVRRLVLPDDHELPDVRTFDCIDCHSQHGRGGGRQGGGPGKHHFRAPRGDRRGPGCDQGPCGSGRGMGRGMGKGDGTGPRAGSDCPQAQQPDDTADDQ